MRQLFFMGIIVTLLFSADGFDAFDRFEQADKKSFEQLEKQIRQCIDHDDFSCAREKLEQIKPYVSTKKDSRTIANLREDLNSEEQRYEAALQANKNHTVTIGNCQNGSGSARMCNLYVDGQYDGNIFYKPRSDGNEGYDIFTIGSKHVSASMGGFYDSSLHRVWTTACGDSVFGRSSKIMVYSVSDALKMFANCGANGRYR